MNNSSLFKINLKDVINSLVLGLITSVLTALLPILDSGTFPTFDNLKVIITLGITTAVSNVIRKFVTNSNNVPLLPEKK